MTPANRQSVNQWDQIDDFKWLKAEPSPHFSILPALERIGEDVWKVVMAGKEDASWKRFWER